MSFPELHNRTQSIKDRPGASAVLFRGLPGKFYQELISETLPIN